MQGFSVQLWQASYRGINALVVLGDLLSAACAPFSSAPQTEHSETFGEACGAFNAVAKDWPGFSEKRVHNETAR